MASAIFLGSTGVVIDMQTEVNCSYTHHRLRPPSQRAVQLPAVPHNICASSHNNVTDAAKHAGLDERFHSNSDLNAAPQLKQQVQRQQHRKRTRSSCLAFADELDSRFPGNCRHRMIIKHLESALPTFLRWHHEQIVGRQAAAQGMPTANREVSTSDYPASNVLQDAAAGPPANSATVAAGTQEALQQGAIDAVQALAQQAHVEPVPHCDWVSLAALASVLRPKFQPATGSSPDNSKHCLSLLQAPCNLFNTLIENSSGQDAVAVAHEAHVLLPPLCSFLMSDVKRLRPLINGVSRYRLIVLDPPWENRSVKRGGQYSTLPSNCLLSLPIPRLLDQEHGLVAMWITNRERLRTFIEQQLLPAWQLQHCATWYWLKVDASTGQPVLPLSSLHRHPYEQLMLLRPMSADGPGSACAGASPASQPLRPPGRVTGSAGSAGATGRDNRLRNARCADPDASSLPDHMHGHTQHAADRQEAAIRWDSVDWVAPQGSVDHAPPHNGKPAGAVCASSVAPLHAGHVTMTQPQIAAAASDSTAAVAAAASVESAGPLPSTAHLMDSCRFNMACTALAGTAAAVPTTLISTTAGAAIHGVHDTCLTTAAAAGPIECAGPAAPITSVDDAVDTPSQHQPSRSTHPIVRSAVPGAQAAAPANLLPTLPDGFVIFCTPGAHSRKPHLGRLLTPFATRARGYDLGQPTTSLSGASCAAPSNRLCNRTGTARGGESIGHSSSHLAAGGAASGDLTAHDRLELFARELHSGWTSWGNEVLHFQGLDDFVALPSR